MPQFEIRQKDGTQFDAIVRGRSCEDAVARFMADSGVLGPKDIVIDAKAANPDGWRRIMIDDQPSGFVREHHRMRFRRD